MPPSTMIDSSNEGLSSMGVQRPSPIRGETEKSASFRLTDLGKPRGSSRTLSTKRLSQSSSLSDLESSFASLRVEEEGVQLKSCMKVRTLEDSLSAHNGSFELAFSEDSMQAEGASPKKKPPQFSTVEIREYPPMLGDNPSAMDGVPLTIGWKPQESSTRSVDEYEEDRGPRRHKNSLSLPVLEREERLLDAGCSWSEIMETKKEIRKIQRERIVQMRNSQLHDKIEERTEAINKKLKRWVLRQPKDRALYDQFREQQVAYLLEKQEERERMTASNDAPAETTKVGS